MITITIRSFCPPLSKLFIKRFYAVPSLPLETPAKFQLKIFSLRDGGCRLSDGKVHEGNMVIVGGCRLNWNLNSEGRETAIDESIKALLKVLRPVPDIVIVGVDKGYALKLNLSDYGCSVEVSDPVIIHKYKHLKFIHYHFIILRV